MKIEIEMVKNKKNYILRLNSKEMLDIYRALYFVYKEVIADEGFKKLSDQLSKFDLYPYTEL